jgi:hypothetical protein
MRISSAIFSLCLITTACLSAAGVAHAEDKGSAAYYAVENDDLFVEAIEKHGAAHQASGVPSRTKEGDSVDLDLEYLVKIPAGAEGKVLSSYSEALMRAIAAEQGKVTPKSRVAEGQLRGFTLRYVCGGATGVVRVHIEPHKNAGEHLIFVYCYEVAGRS